MPPAEIFGMLANGSWDLGCETGAGMFGLGSPAMLRDFVRASEVCVGTTFGVPGALHPNNRIKARLNCDTGILPVREILSTSKMPVSRGQHKMLLMHAFKMTVISNM